MTDHEAIRILQGRWDELGHTYRINIRPTYKGSAARPEALAAQGALVKLSPMWLMHKDDRYPGEVAFGHMDEGDTQLYDMCQTAWIASGDLELA